MDAAPSRLPKAPKTLSDSMKGYFGEDGETVVIAAKIAFPKEKNSGSPCTAKPRTIGMQKIRSSSRCDQGNDLAGGRE